VNYEKNPLYSAFFGFRVDGKRPAYSQISDDRLNQQVNKMGQALFYVGQYYLDSIDTEKVVDGMMKTLVDQLDPHSSYIPADEVKAMNEPLEGNFEGIGIEFAIIRDTLVVVNPIAGAPSESVGKRAETGLWPWTVRRYPLRTLPTTGIDLWRGTQRDHVWGGRSTQVRE
jgi:hypothetical protein